MFFYPFFYDPYFWLLIVAMLISGWASFNVNHTFKKYSDLDNQGGYSGREAARAILDQAGLEDVQIQEISGQLTDNYNPKTKVLSLSEPVYSATSIAAVGVAAHEAGHAVQDAVSYAPMRWRAGLVPVVNLGSQLSMPLILIGCLFGFNETLIRLGILCFGAVLLFQIVTLPVEFNASHRALSFLKSSQLLNGQELQMGQKVLFAAALTYVAAVLSTILQLLRLVLLFGGGDQRN